MEQVDVLVAGAGPTGLMLGCELLRQGLSVLLVDPMPAPSPLSRAIVLQARSLEVLEAHGLSQELVDAGVRLGAVSFHAGQRRVEVSFGSLPTRYPFLLCLPQSATEAALTRRLDALGGRVQRGVALEGFTATDDGVRARLSDRDVRAAWLVGCDGAHSQVRHVLGAAFAGHAYDERLVLGDVTWDADLPRDRLSSFLGDGFLAAFPLPDGQTRVIATVDQGEGPLPLEELAALCAARTPYGGRLRAASWLARFRIHARQVERYRFGRVLLAGDAAHVHSPAGGQGLNLGLQDAHNLGWKLALVHRGAPDALLDSYSAERHPVAARTLRATDTATRLGTARHPWIRAARDIGAAAFVRIGPALDAVTRAVAELDTTYEGSPIVVDDAPGKPRAGCRPAGLPVEARHVLLPVAGPRATDEGRLRLRACVAVARDAWSDRVVVGSSEERMGIEADGVLLVRPDGYVGARLSPASPERLATVLSRLVGPPCG